MIATAINRGWRKRCPHCGRGELSWGWAHHLERCSVSGLVYERNPGDTWAFTILGDRLPVAVLVGIIVAFIIVGVFFFWSSPNRWGVGIALHYLTRVFWPDPADPVPDEVNPRDKQSPEEH
jgi:uncharacterized protein (DUF983 family)